LDDKPTLFRKVIFDVAAQTEPSYTAGRTRHRQ